jgi:hypothetical protein
MIASPRTVWPPNDRAMRLSGAPAWRCRICTDQAVRKPQLAGLNGAMRMPGSSAVQPASEPSRGQEAPPRASTVAAARDATAPSGVSKRSVPSSSRPAQRWRSASLTPSPSSRRSHARSSGEAFIARGNTRPLEPMKVSCPSRSAQAMSADGGNTPIAGASQARALP